MAKNPLLTKAQMKVRYPNRWLLVTYYKLDRSTCLRSGRVVASSRDRGEIHRVLKKQAGKLCIHFTGSLPRDTGVLFPCPV